MIINFICLAGGFIGGFFTAALMVAASSYDHEGEDDDSLAQEYEITERGDKI